MRIVHVVVTGRVQGVGYRAWTMEEAQSRGLSGWVRNRRDGCVEAVFCGPESRVRDMLAACHSGPSAARVTDVAVGDMADPPPPGFRALPSV